MTEHNNAPSHETGVREALLERAETFLSEAGNPYVDNLVTDLANAVRHSSPPPTAGREALIDPDTGKPFLNALQGTVKTNVAYVPLATPSPSAEPVAEQNRSEALAPCDHDRRTPASTGSVVNEPSVAIPSSEKLAEVVHIGRFPIDRTPTPFVEECKSGREYCFRIASAIRTVLYASPVSDASREALKPFAKIADDYDAAQRRRLVSDPDAKPLADQMRVSIPIGDCRKARAALSPSFGNTGVRDHEQT